MSGLYNMVFGQRREALLCCAVLNIQPQEFGRFRDAWVERVGDGYRIAIYTRNGGNNRAEHMPPGLKEHSLYLEDRDDSFDSTYATVYFKLPGLDDIPPGVEITQEAWERGLDVLKQVAFPEPRDMGKVWEKAIEDLRTKGTFG